MDQDESKWNGILRKKIFLVSFLFCFFVFVFLGEGGGRFCGQRSPKREEYWEKNSGRYMIKRRYPFRTYRVGDLVCGPRNSLVLFCWLVSFFVFVCVFLFSNRKYGIWYGEGLMKKWDGNHSTHQYDWDLYIFTYKMHIYIGIQIKRKMTTNGRWLSGDDLLFFF